MCKVEFLFLIKLRNKMHGLVLNIKNQNLSALAVFPTFQIKRPRQTWQKLILNYCATHAEKTFVAIFLFLAAYNALKQRRAIFTYIEFCAKVGH